MMRDGEKRSLVIKVKCRGSDDMKRFKLLPVGVDNLRMELGKRLGMDNAVIFCVKAETEGRMEIVSDDDLTRASTDWLSGRDSKYLMIEVHAKDPPAGQMAENPAEDEALMPGEGAGPGPGGEDREGPALQAHSQAHENSIQSILRCARDCWYQRPRGDLLYGAFGVAIIAIVAALCFFLTTHPCGDPELEQLLKAHRLGNID